MFKLYRLTDLIINLCRWPAAILLLLSIPILLQTYGYFNYATFKFYSFFGGIALFVATVIFAGTESRQSLQIVAHELTHSFFALLTLHSVHHIRLNPDGTGGSMQLMGGNWLIILAPYFFPLFAFFYMLIMPYIYSLVESVWILHGILGYLTAYYWATVISQIHPQQTDIIRSGYIFSAIIILAMNLYMTGCIFAYNNNLWHGLTLYHKTLYKLGLKDLHYILNLIA